MSSSSGSGTSGSGTGAVAEPRRRDDRRDAPPSLVSVIVPVHNAADLLGHQLEALAEQDHDGAWEVVVVDNRSTDGSADRARALADRLPALTVVAAHDRPSAGYARNVGARAARGDLLLFCDADDVADPGWVGAMARAAPIADILGGRLDLDALNDPLIRSWRFKSEGLGLGVRFFPYASTANCGVWTSVFAAVGGWSEEFAGAAGEDIDFAARAYLAGYRVSYAPDAVMRYRFRPGLRALARQTFHYERSNALLYRKFRHAGARRRPLRATMNVWAWVLLHTPDLLRSAERRGVWVRQAANACGRVSGSWRHRVLFL